MSGYGILGGIGQGLMQGSQAIGQQRKDAQTAKYMEAVTTNMNAANERATYDHERKVADQQRLDTYNTLSNQIDGNYQDRSPEERMRMKLEYGSQTGLISQKEREDLGTKVDALEKEGLISAYETRNTGAIGKALSRRMGRPVQASIGKDGSVSLVGEDGTPLGDMPGDMMTTLAAWKKMSEADRKAKRAEGMEDETHEMGIRKGHAQIANWASNNAVDRARIGQINADRSKTVAETKALGGMDPKAQREYQKEIDTHLDLVIGKDSPDRPKAARILADIQRANPSMSNPREVAVQVAQEIETANYVNKNNDGALGLFGNQQDGLTLSSWRYDPTSKEYVNNFNQTLTASEFKDAPPSVQRHILGQTEVQAGRRAQDDAEVQTARSRDEAARAPKPAAAEPETTEIPPPPPKTIGLSKKANPGYAEWEKQYGAAYAAQQAAEKEASAKRLSDFHARREQQNAFRPFQ